jgi:hypothetical protein
MYPKTRHQESSDKGTTSLFPNARKLNHVWIIRTNVAAGIAILFRIAGMFYAMADTVGTRSGQPSVVESTPDGR